ncbi:MAG: PIG-L family deacetylase [Rhodoferax sp.]|nr:PIG-L family deacetylase [Rhodoferax sp.]
MPNPFSDYVRAFPGLLRCARAADMRAAAAAPMAPALLSAPVCLIFSPHPDDEAIAGALPWRLRSQNGWRVVNVAVTLGSNHTRRAARWQEAQACCDYLSFELCSASGETQIGMERITPATERSEPGHWAASVQKIAAVLLQYQPRVIVCPHADDGHPVHVGTHFLVHCALGQIGSALLPHVLLSEYWNTQGKPGLMVELGVPEVTRLVSALSLHVGEVARNPYHLTLPVCFMDAVRRGSERVGAAGAPGAGFDFAALYGWTRWNGSHCVAQPTRLLPLTSSPAAFFV